MAFDGWGHDQSAFGRGKKPGESPVDRSKQGTKRSLLVEASGVPVGLSVASANKNDFKMFVETLRSSLSRAARAFARSPSAPLPG